MADSSPNHFLVSLTRLRLARLRDLGVFNKISGLSIRQAKLDPQCLAGATYFGPWLTFWTATVWVSEEAMLAYVRSGDHKTAMPHLARLCSEATIARYPTQARGLPRRTELLVRMLEQPKFFHLASPSRAQQEKKIPGGLPWLTSVFK